MQPQLKQRITDPYVNHAFYCLLLLFHGKVIHCISNHLRTAHSPSKTLMDLPNRIFKWITKHPQFSLKHLNHPTASQLKDTLLSIHKNSIFNVRSKSLYQTFTSGLISLYIPNSQICHLLLRSVPPHQLEFILPFDCLVILHGLYTERLSINTLHSQCFETCNRMYESELTFNWILQHLVYNSRYPHGLHHISDNITNFITLRHNSSYFLTLNYVVNCVYQAFCSDNIRYQGHTTDIHRLISGPIKVRQLFQTPRLADYLFILELSPKSFIESGRLACNDDSDISQQWLDCNQTLGKLPIDIAYDITKMSYNSLTHCQCINAEHYTYDMSQSCVYILQTKFSMTKESEAFCTITGIVRTTPSEVQSVICFSNNFGKEYTHRSTLLHGNHFPKVPEYDILQYPSGSQYQRNLSIMTLVNNAIKRPFSKACTIKGTISLCDRRIHCNVSTAMEPVDDESD